jgi:predicted DNA-binding transcriptional regulator AlpA
MDHPSVMTDGEASYRGLSVMRSNPITTSGDTPLAALMRETAAATVDTVLAELRRRPVVHPEWLSLQDAAAYTGYSEQQFSDFVKRDVAPKSVLFSRNARRFKRSDRDAWCAAGGPSAYASKGDTGAVHR